MIFDFRFSIVDFLKRHWRTALPLGAVALAFLAIFPYYAWKAAIRREFRQQVEQENLRSQISDLRSQAQEAKQRAATAEGREKQFTARLAEKEKVHGQLAGQLAKLKVEAAAEQARIAALSPQEAGQELQKTVPTAEILRGVHPERKLKGTLRSAQGDSERTQDDSEGARRVLEIIAERDACREQIGVKDQQFANCRESLIDYAAVGEQQAKQIGDLKQALDLNKRAFDKRDDLAKKELKTAKDSWLGRTLGKAKWFVIGVGAGAIAGVIAAH
jgi:chromosome segregation ATPase